MTIKVTYQKTFQKETQPLLNTKKRAKSPLFIFKTTFRGILAGVGQ